MTETKIHPTAKTRDEWKAWFLMICNEYGYADARTLDSIADMGEQVDMLHAARLAAFGGEIPRGVRKARENKVPLPPVDELLGDGPLGY